MEYNLDLVEETMTSFDLAELSGKRHNNLMREIDTMCENAEITLLRAEQRLKDNAGNEPIELGVI